MKKSEVIKTALMCYYRFRRQCFAIDEAWVYGGNADVLVDNGKEIHEIEIKISKYDLTVNETKKFKHNAYQNFKRTDRIPNKFSICVPEDLVDEAIKWVEKINPKYGVIQCSENNPYGGSILIRRTARSLHDGYSDRLRKKLCMRMSSKIIGILQKRFQDEEKEKRESARASL